MCGDPVRNNRPVVAFPLRRGADFPQGTRRVLSGRLAGQALHDPLRCSPQPPVISPIAALGVPVPPGDVPSVSGHGRDRLARHRRPPQNIAARRREAELSRELAGGGGRKRLCPGRKGRGGGAAAGRRARWAARRGGGSSAAQRPVLPRGAGAATAAPAEPCPRPRSPRPPARRWPPLPLRTRRPQGPPPPMRPTAWGSACARRAAP